MALQRHCICLLLPSPLTVTMSNPSREVTPDALLQADSSEGSLRSRPVGRSSLHAAALHIGPSNLHAAETTLHLAQELTSDTLFETLQAKRSACSLRSKHVRRSSLHAAAKHIGPSHLHAAATTLHLAQGVTTDALLETPLQANMSVGSLRSKPVRRSRLHVAAKHVGPSNLYVAATTRPTEEVTVFASLEVSPRNGMLTDSWRSKPSVRSSTEDIETTLQSYVNIPVANTFASSRPSIITSLDSVLHFSEPSTITFSSMFPTLAGMTLSDIIVLSTMYTRASPPSLRSTRTCFTY